MNLLIKNNMETRMLKFAGVIINCAILTGCAITSSAKVGPHGRPVHFIDGMSASVTYNKAASLCPNGYDIIGEAKQISIMDYTMTIECK